MPPETSLGAYWAGYARSGPAFDELVGERGAPRGHWAYLARAWAELGEAERRERQRAVQRALRESGASYNVYGEVEGGERPWQLDALPLLIDSRAWTGIEQGLIQRAELLDAVLADVYGPRRLITQGLIPPELIFGHRGFLRPAVGISPAGGRHIELYAADLARAPDGGLRVLADRTQAPSGAGYALENRLVISRVLPSMFRESRVHRLAGFFRALRERLGAIAPASEDGPSVVVLTPGPRNETFFEHTYLASYLGYPLVQGADLTVRDGRVWMKTLEALQPVDVILRRLDDDFCDPVELREDSLLGTPGLLGVVRAGRVALANPVGCGVVENPGLLPLLPALCRELLGETLRLPGIDTWWCGEPASCQHVIANLDRLVVKPIARRLDEPTVYAGELAAAEREALAARIRAEPWRWVGQERLETSTSPVAVGERPEPRPTVLRGFLVAQGGGYLAMPGALARVAPETDAWLVTNQRGGIAKDAWVLASEPVREDSLLVARGRDRSSRGEPELPSRVADDLFWFGRYAERSEAAARVLLAVAQRVGSPPLDSDGDEARTLGVLLHALCLTTAQSPGLIAHGPAALLPALLGEAGRPGSLPYDLEALQRTARGLRDRLPVEARRVLQALSERSAALSGASGAASSLAPPLLEYLLGLLAALGGVLTETLPRSTAWCFLDCGRRLERALNQLALMRAALGPRVCGLEALDALMGLAQLRQADGRRLPPSADLAVLVERLLRDSRNPRAVAWQLEALRQHLASLPGAARGAPQRDEERLVLEAVSALALADPALLVAPVQRAEPPRALEALLAREERLLGGISDALTRRWFGYATERVSQLTRVL